MVKTTQIIAASGLLFVGCTHGFLTAPMVSRAVRGGARSALRMAGQADNAGDHLKKAGHEVKQAARAGVNEVEAKTQTGQTGKTGNKIETSSARVTASGSGAETAKARVTATGENVEQREVIREAPIIKERIHEETVEVDKTKVVQLKDRTEVVQKIQPIKDEQRRELDVKSVDHGTEIREQGKAGLDEGARAELEKRRLEVESKAGTVRDASTKRVSERPDVVREEQVHVVEQVVPVVERDVYVPHRVENEKKIVEITHERPVVKETVVEAAISKEEFERKYGKQVDVKAAAPQRSVTETARSTTATTGTAATTGTTATTGTAATRAAAAAPASTRASSTHKVEETHHTNGAAEDDSYQMSSSNMVKNAGEKSEGGGGIGNAIKAPFKAIANAIKD